MIIEKDGFRLYRPLNTWDMNYHLIELATNTDHMIDIDDVAEFLDEKEFFNLEDIDAAIEAAWKIKEAPYTIDIELMFSRLSVK